MRPNPAGGCRALRSVGSCVSLAAVIALACGCVGEFDQYTIVVTPRSDSLERSIRIERRRTGEDSLRVSLRPRLEPGVMERLSAAYHVPVDTAATAPYVARGHFADVPDDIGTQGHYLHRVTPLGESFFYAERIRGMEDPAGWIARRLASADTLAAGVGGWLRFELVTQPEWPRVAGELEPELQAIAKKFAVVMLAAGDADSLAWGWLLSFAPEHPLFALLVVPGLEDSVEALSHGPYIAHARADLVRRLGLHSEADEARVLGFLADGPSALTSYRRWAERSPEARAFNRSVGRVFPTAMERLGGWTDIAHVDVELRVPRPPFITNGQWSDSGRTVRWRGSCARLSDRDGALPLSCAAVWCVPDSVLQRRLLGDVVLDDDGLFNYAEWFTTLTPVRRAEWNRMLLALRPGRLEPLDRFRFTGERGAADASAYGRSAIRDAVRARAEKRAEAVGPHASPKAR